ncbi:unnamed protein product [Linum trigynum]|uniref:Uncharacterized protein n=1 Tax=Linum trigynum TaxID=586398 RepID=A0AAV2CSQ4_9ROSI
MVSERRSRSRGREESHCRIGSRDWRWRRGAAVPVSPSLERKRSRTVAARREESHCRCVAARGEEERKRGVARRLGFVNLCDLRFPIRVGRELGKWAGPGEWGSGLGDG